MRASTFPNESMRVESVLGLSTLESLIAARYFDLVDELDDELAAARRAASLAVMEASAFRHSA